MSNKQSKKKTKAGLETDYIDIAVQLFIACKGIVLCYSLYKEYCSKPSYERSEKDIIIGNALLDSCIINWCKLFGSANNNQLHIKKVLKPYHYPLANVLSTVCSDLKLSKKKLDNMHETLKMWRNKVVAHLDYSEVIDVKLSTCYFDYIPLYAKSVSGAIAEVFKEEYQYHPEVKFNFKNSLLNFEELSQMILDCVKEFPTV